MMFTKETQEIFDTKKQRSKNRGQVPAVPHEFSPSKGSAGAA